MSGRRAAWRTDARRAILMRDWPAGIRRDVIHARMLAEPGPAFPAHHLAVWAGELRLSRPGNFRRDMLRTSQEAARLASAAKRAARAQARRAAQAPCPAPPPQEDDEAAPVALLPPGTLRQTPNLRAALDLLAYGLRPEEIRDRVKLTAVEYAKVRDVHREQVSPRRAEAAAGAEAKLAGWLAVETQHGR